MAFGRSALIPLALATAIFVAGTVSVAVRGAEDAAPAAAVATATPEPTVTPAPTVTPPPPPPATPTPIPHLSRTEYVQRAEAICVEMNQQEEEMEMDWEYLDEAAQDIRRMLDVSHEAYDRLRALSAPPEDVPFLEDHLFTPVGALLDFITPHMERMAAAFEEGNLREMGAVVHEMEAAEIPPTLLEDHETPLRDYGFDECVLEDDPMGPPGGPLQA